MYPGYILMSTNPERTDQIIINLKVLAALKASDRLYTRNGAFEVQDNGWIQAFFRRAQGDTRWSNMDDMKVLVEDALRLLDAYTSYASPSAASTAASVQYPQPPASTSHAFVRMLVGELSGACTGFQNLKLTYAADSRMCAHLDVLLQKIQSRIGAARAALPDIALPAPPAPDAAAAAAVVEGGGSVELQPFALSSLSPLPPPPPHAPSGAGVGGGASGAGGGGVGGGASGAGGGGGSGGIMMKKKS
jgi:uncharacterized membrane protein YgcG